VTLKLALTPTSGFTGLDTFPITVTTVWNAAGGTGSAGGTAHPGGPATMTITLNVIPASTTLAVTEGIARPVPVPAGSVSGCSAVGNLGNGPVAGVTYGCVTAITKTANPSHGTLATVGNALSYTPAVGYVGSDTFTYDALGVNNDGTLSLDSGAVTVTVTVSAANTPLPPTWTLLLLGIATLALFESLRRRRRAL